MALERELETYRRELPSHLIEEGKFALVKGEEFEGVYDTYRDAMKMGYSKFGLAGFMVKKIQAVERALTFTRDLWPT